MTPSSSSDHYQALGLDRDAGADDIKRAYRRLARQYHPDVAGEANGDEDFRAVNEAYQVLSDPRRREMYDLYGTDDPRTTSMGDPFGGGVEDVFSMFFGGMGATTGRAARVDGRDLAAQVQVTLLEAADGADKDLTYTRDAACTVCGGSGSRGEGGTVTCPDCGGSGQRVTTRQTFLGAMRTAVPCQRCGATGVTIDDPCPNCGGSGRAATRETVTIPIPEGVADGATIRLEGLGEAGVRGARAGDLLVHVRVAPHPTLHRQGDDLHVRVRVPLTRAVLGGDVTVPGLRGPQEVHIPAGSTTGDHVRVKGQGMPRGGRRSGMFSGPATGDLFAHLDVEIPSKLTHAQKKLMHDLEKSLGGSDDLTAEPLDDWLS
jgi:molecular chaperone DnaJ